MSAPRMCFAAALVAVLASGCAGEPPGTEGADLAGTWRAAGVELTLLEDGGFESRGLSFGLREPGGDPADARVVGTWVLDDSAGEHSDGVAVVLTIDAPGGPGLIPVELTLGGGSTEPTLLVEAADDPDVGPLELER